MKNGKFSWAPTLIVAAMLLLAHRSHALFTPYLVVASNQFAAFATTLTNDTPHDRALGKALARALKDLSKPSSSVAQDYKLFTAAATHLGPFALQPPFGEAGSNIFNIFMAEAQLEIVTTAGRIAALNDFVRMKKSASNQLAQAVKNLNRIPTLPDARLAILVGGQVYAKIVAANRLAATGEAHPGFAANSLVGATLHHTERNGSGQIVFQNDVQATETETGGSPTAITYTYERTGLNTATLVLNEGANGTTTVKLRFTSATGGTFTFRHDDTDGSVQRGTGTFTLN